MAQIKIDGKMYTLTADERDALNAETIFQNASDAGEFPLDGAIELYKMWFEM